MKRAAAIARAIMKGKSLPPMDLSRTMQAKRLFLTKTMKDASGSVHLLLVDGARLYVATVDLAEIREALGRRASLFQTITLQRPRHFLIGRIAAAMIRNGLAPSGWLERKEKD